MFFTSVFVIGFFYYTYLHNYVLIIACYKNKLKRSIKKRNKRKLEIVVKSDQYFIQIEKKIIHCH
jgi:hypothetical protein